jgi:glycerol-3-phosphate dehydrogenase
MMKKNIFLLVIWSHWISFCSSFVRSVFSEVSLHKSRLFAVNERSSSSTATLKFAILGGGAFSLALAKVLSYKNVKSTILVRNASVAASINQNRNHPNYLSQYHLPSIITATTCHLEAFQDCSHIIFALPMSVASSFLSSVQNDIPSSVPILSVTKGIERTSFSLMDDIFRDTLGNDRKTAYLSGPSFAEEIMKELPTTVVIASDDSYTACEFSDILSNSLYFRCHISYDVKVRFIRRDSCLSADFV